MRCRNWIDEQRPRRNKKNDITIGAEKTWMCIYINVQRILGEEWIFKIWKSIKFIFQNFNPRYYSLSIFDRRYGGIRGSYQHFTGQGGQDSGFPSPRSALGYPFPPMHQNSYSGYHLGSYAPPCSSPPKDGKPNPLQNTFPNRLPTRNNRGEFFT